MKKILLLSFFLGFVSVVTYSQKPKKVRVVENSRIAKLVGRINKEDRYAMTFGRTIFINCKKEEFYGQPRWVKHEFTHVEQYKKEGVLSFLTKYIFYSAFHDYSNIPYEKEALAAENADL